MNVLDASAAAAMATYCEAARAAAIVERRRRTAYHRAYQKVLAKNYKKTPQFPLFLDSPDFFTQCVVMPPPPPPPPVVGAGATQAEGDAAVLRTQRTPPTHLYRRELPPSLVGIIEDAVQRVLLSYGFDVMSDETEDRAKFVRELVYMEVDTAVAHLKVIIDGRSFNALALRTDPVLRMANRAEYNVFSAANFERVYTHHKAAFVPEESKARNAEFARRAALSGTAPPGVRPIDLARWMYYARQSMRREVSTPLVRERVLPSGALCRLFSQSTYTHVRRRVTLTRRVRCAVSRRWLEAGDTATLYVCAPVVSDRVSVLNAVETADGRAHRVADPRNAVVVFFVADAEATATAPKKRTAAAADAEQTPSQRLAAAVRALAAEDVAVRASTMALAMDALGAEAGVAWRAAPDNVVMAVSLALCCVTVHASQDDEDMAVRKCASHALARASCMMLHQSDDVRGQYADDAALVLAHLARGTDGGLRCRGLAHDYSTRLREPFIGRATAWLDAFLAPPRVTALVACLEKHADIRQAVAAVCAMLWPSLSASAN